MTKRMNTQCAATQLGKKKKTKEEEEGKDRPKSMIKLDSAMNSSLYSCLTESIFRITNNSQSTYNVTLPM